MGLLDFVFGKPKPQEPQPGGLLGGANRDLTSRDAYLKHVSDAQEQGQTPLTYDAWVKAQQAKQLPK